MLVDFSCFFHCLPVWLYSVDSAWLPGAARVWYFSHMWATCYCACLNLCNTTEESLIIQSQTHLISYNFYTMKAPSFTHLKAFVILLWSSIKGNLVFSPAVTKHDSCNSWKWTRWNSETQQMFLSAVSLTTGCVSVSWRCFISHPKGCGLRHYLSTNDPQVVFTTQSSRMSLATL